MINLIRVKNALYRNGFICDVFETGQDAVNYFLLFLNSHPSVGMSGSVTLEQLGLYDKLIERGIDCKWHWRGDSYEETLKQAAKCDYYVSGANALTENGELLLVDANGNRISSTIFGHEKVFFFVGRNKIVRNKEEATRRVKNVALPLNYKRYKEQLNSRKYPGKYENLSEEDMYAAELFINKSLRYQDTYVFIINEDLGY